MDALQRAVNGEDGQDDYMDRLDPHELDDEELQVLSPRRKVLVELEKMLDEEIPATRKTHSGRDWKKASPNVANEDLYAILRGICRTMGVAPQIARTVRPDVLQLPPGQARVYHVLDQDGGFMSAGEIAEDLGLDRSTVAHHLRSMKRRVDFQTRTVGQEGSSYVKEYRLPPAYQDLEV